MNAKPLFAIAAVVAVVAIPLSLFVASRNDEESARQRKNPPTAGSSETVPADRPPAQPPKSPVVVAEKSPSPQAKAEEAASADLNSSSPQTVEDLTAKTRKSAEEVTQKRYTEKMERLARKLGLTQEQIDKIGEHHLAQRLGWIEYLTGAAFDKADPQYYSLEAGYREDIPPPLQSLLTEEQLKLYREHDTNKRTNHIESVTSGEINYLAQRLDLNPAKKDVLFEKLAEINRTDLFTDLTGVRDLDAIARQADYDVGRRRSAFAAVLDEQEMKLWEDVVAGYRKEVLRRFGQRSNATAGAGEGTAAGNSSNG